MMGTSILFQKGRELMNDYILWNRTDKDIVRALTSGVDFFVDKFGYSPSKIYYSPSEAERLPKLPGIDYVSSNSVQPLSYLITGA